MDHNLAAETQAVERYLLGEMPPIERDDFEEHYFGCTVCSGEMRTASRFRNAARQVLREPERFESSGTKSLGAWWQMPAFLPMAAGILLVSVVAVYQAGFEIPSLKRQLAGHVAPIAEAVTTIPLAQARRGGEPDNVARIPRNTSHVRLNFEVMLDENPRSYECTISDSPQDHRRSNAGTPKPGALPDIDLYPQSLTPGQYHITLRALPNPQQFCQFFPKL